MPHRRSTAWNDAPRRRRTSRAAQRAVASAPALLGQVEEQRAEHPGTAGASNLPDGGAAWQQRTGAGSIRVVVSPSGAGGSPSDRWTRRVGRPSSWSLWRLPAIRELVLLTLLRVRRVLRNSCVASVVGVPVPVRPHLRGGPGDDGDVGRRGWSSSSFPRWSAGSGSAMGLSCGKVVGASGWRRRAGTWSRCRWSHRSSGRGDPGVAASEPPLTASSVHGVVGGRGRRLHWACTRNVRLWSARHVLGPCSARHVRCWLFHLALAIGADHQPRVVHEKAGRRRAALTAVLPSVVLLTITFAGGGVTTYHRRRPNGYLATLGLLCGLTAGF